MKLYIYYNKGFCIQTVVKWVKTVEYTHHQHHSNQGYQLVILWPKAVSKRLNSAKGKKAYSAHIFQRNFFGIALKTLKFQRF
jgi:hypothetical protein